MEAQSGQLPNAVVIFSTADWDAQNKTNKQHMAYAFAQLSYKVLYIESFGLRAPNAKSKRDYIRILKRLVLCWRLVRKVSDNIWVCSPLVLPVVYQNWFFKRLNVVVLKIQIRLCLIFLKIKAFIFWSYHAYTESMSGHPGMMRVIYHSVDDLGAVPGIEADEYESAERAFLCWTDEVFVTSKTLQKN